MKRRVAVALLLSLASSLAAQQFAAGGSWAVGAEPQDLAVADFNGDGNLDVAIAVGSANAVALLLGDGGGGFRPAPGSPFGALAQPHLIAAGDVDGDGRPDVVASAHDSNTVAVLLNRGGRLQHAPGSPVTAFNVSKPHNHGLALADMNGDSRLDITVGHQDEGRIAVLLNQGNARFRAATGSPFEAGSSPYPHVAADVNGDGHPDLIVPDVRGNSINLLLGDGRGGFRPPQRTSVTPRPYAVVTGEFDGKTLHVAATHDDRDDVTVLRSSGNGLQPVARARSGRRGWRLKAADLNGDGHLDLAIGSNVGVLLLAGDGAGNFTPLPGLPLATGRGSWAVAIADVNRDGKPDVLAVSAADGVLRLFVGR